MPTSLQSKFPAGREFAGNFCRIWTRSVIFACDRLADSISCMEIPYATEQRISLPFLSKSRQFIQKSREFLANR